MKFTVVALLLAASGFAQDAPKPTHIIHYTTLEKCHDCGLLYAIGCSSDNPDCGIPMVREDHYAEFSSIKDAMEFINSGFMRCRNIRSWSLSPTTGESATYKECSTGSGVLYTPPNQPELVSIYKVEEIKVIKKVQEKHEPQPDKVTEVVTYNLESTEK